jgi:acetate kinase
LKVNCSSSSVLFKILNANKPQQRKADTSFFGNDVDFLVVFVDHHLRVRVDIAFLNQIGKIARHREELKRFSGDLNLEKQVIATDQINCIGQRHKVCIINAILGLKRVSKSLKNVQTRLLRNTP